MFFLPPALVLDAPPPLAAATTAMPLDLSGALARARADNPQILSSRAAVAERQGLITTTRADALPQVTLGGDFTRVRDVSILNSGIGDSIGTIFPGYTADMLVGARNVYTTQATLSQPLYYWGKLGKAVEVAKMGEKEAAFAYTTTELDVLHGVARAYLTVLEARVDLEVVATRLKTAERFLEDMRAKEEAQTVTQLDRLRAESEVLAVKPENLQADANYQRALELLNGQLGQDPRTPLLLADLGQPALETAASPGERSEVSRLKQQEAMYQANDQIIKADLRPKFDFSASYGFQTATTENQFKEPYDAWRVSVTLKFPIFDGLRTSGKRAQNRAQQEQVRQARADLERSVAVQKSTAARELQKSVLYADASRKAYDAALEALRISRDSFDQGLITSYELLQTERTERLQESQRRKAELEVWSAVFNQRRALGLPPLP